MLSDPIFYLLAVPAVILLGLAKGGFSGMGALSLPMLLFAVDPVQAAAILLPILMVQDVVSVWAFRRTIDWSVIRAMLPGATLGILIGYLYAASVSPGRGDGGGRRDLDSVRRIPTLGRTRRSARAPTFGPGGAAKRSVWHRASPARSRMQARRPFSSGCCPAN